MPRTKEQFELLRKESRKKILDTALELFARDGYKTTTIGAIAKTAGISQGLLYNYFKSKEEVLHELIMGITDVMIQEFGIIQPGKKLTREDMIKFIDVSIDLVIERPQFWKLYFSIFVQPDVLSLLFDKMMEYMLPYMDAITNYYKDKGVSDPVAKMRYFLAAMDGIQMHCMIDPQTFPVKEVKKLIIKQFL